MNIIKKIKDYKGEWETIQREYSLRLKQSKYRQSCNMYAEVFASNKVNPMMILYESFWGRGMIDNPYALFKVIFTKPEYKAFQHVWVLDNFEDHKLLIEKYNQYTNVRFVEFGSRAYMEALSQAKYLINNTTFQKYFIKKDDQVYINTWHGTPLKSMGYEMTNGNTGVANVVRNFLCADYLLSANEIMTNMYLRSYKLERIMPGEIIQQGYPRNDTLVNTPRDRVMESLREQGIYVEDGKKVILFAPTWREVNPGQAIINPDELLGVKAVLEQNIDMDKYQILIKPHQLVYKYLKGIEAYKGLLIPSAIDTNELLSVVDVLISDYSSIFLDFMVLNRPVLFYIPDLSAYKNKRGLDVKPEDLPGPYSDNLLDIAEYIVHLDDVQKKYRAVYEQMRQRVCCHEDGEVSERIVDIIWGKKQNYNKITSLHDKKRLLISHGGLLENGISHSFLSLLEQIDYEEWDVTAFVIDNASNKEMHRKINNMNPNVRVLVKCGNHIATEKEEIRREFMTTRGVYYSLWDKLYPWDVMKREFRRCFGMAEFDYIVDFSGYNPILTPMISQGKAKKKSVWLHSDIKADMNRKVNGKKAIWRNLHFNVSVYPKFDNIVSCSQSVMEVNREKLATSETYNKFTYAKNTVNATRIEKCLHDNCIFEWGGKEYLIKKENKEDEGYRDIDLLELPEENIVNFVTMGRMSTEKNHIALIKAFARLHEEFKQSHLYILGDGPLREKEERIVTELDIGQSVTLTGNISNPFVFMEHCSCFILPSFHEGMPMVLLEARACGLPIIVSDFSSVKDSLYVDGQLVIHTDEDSILEGLRAFVRGEVPVCEFFLEDYNREAYQEFLDAIQ